MIHVSWWVVMSHGVILFALGHIKRHTSMRIFTLNIYLGYPTNYRIGYPGNKLPGYGSLKCIYGDGLALVAVCVCVSCMTLMHCGWMPAGLVLGVTVTTRCTRSGSGSIHGKGDLLRRWFRKFLAGWYSTGNLLTVLNSGLFFSHSLPIPAVAHLLY